MNIEKEITRLAKGLCMGKTKKDKKIICVEVIRASCCDCRNMTDPWATKGAYPFFENESIPMVDDFGDIFHRDYERKEYLCPCQGVYKICLGSIESYDRGTWRYGDRLRSFVSKYVRETNWKKKKYRAEKRIIRARYNEIVRKSKLRKSKKS